MPNTGTLHVAATPIGNLQDISSRGKQVLAGVNLIACEDTRRTRKLLSHFDIHTPTESYHGDSSDTKRNRLIQKLKDGKNLALVSDAGTPAISDPGMRFVRAARDAGAEVVAVPGPSSVTAALSVAGVRAHKFSFLGYVPRKSGRDDFFQELENLDHTAVFFASPHRIDKTLNQLQDTLSDDRTVVVCRELTKQYESIVTGTAEEIKVYFDDNPDEKRGEFVLVIGNDK